MKYDLFIFFLNIFLKNLNLSILDNLIKKYDHMLNLDHRKNGIISISPIKLVSIAIKFSFVDQENFCYIRVYINNILFSATRKFI